MCSDSPTGTRGSLRPCWMKSGARIASMCVIGDASRRNSRSCVERAVLALAGGAPIGRGVLEERDEARDADALDAGGPAAPAGTRALQAPCSRRTSGRRRPRASRRSRGRATEPVVQRRRDRAPSRAAARCRRDARSACRSPSSRGRSAPRPRSPRETRYCVSGAKLGENHGRHCDSGPPWTVTTTGNGPSPSGSKRKTGTDSPSKLVEPVQLGLDERRPGRRRAGSSSGA